MAGMGHANGELIDLESAFDLVQGHVATGGTESVRLGEAWGRVLAEPVVCDVDYPPFEKAMMDGYAVRAADVAGAGGGAVSTLRVVGQVAAGGGGIRRIEDGRRRTEDGSPLNVREAIQINTGAPVPEGADAVVRVEDTKLSSDGARVTVSAGVGVGKNIDRRAKYVSAGAVVLDAGTRLGAAEIGVAAAAGSEVVRVYERPRVAILVTGDELVEVSVRPTGAQIRNSNGPMLDALVRGAGAEVLDLGQVGDDQGLIEERIRRGLGADFLCISGGASMGAFDFVPEVLASCGVRSVFRKVAIKPGKPTLFGVSESGGGVFGLPGNPLAVFVVFRLLVRPAVEKRLGLGGRMAEVVSARLVSEGGLPATKDRQSYWPARLEIDGDGGIPRQSRGLRVERLCWRGSSDLFGFSGANGLIVRRAGSPGAEAGDMVGVHPLGELPGSV